MEILSEKLITAAEAKSILEKRDAEKMTYEQKICSDFMKKNVKLASDDAKAMMGELKGLNVPDDTATMIVNTMPKNVEELKLAFPKDRMVPKSEDLAKIDEIVKKHE